MSNPIDLISRDDIKKQLDFNLKHMEKQYHTILRCIYRQMADLPAVESRPKGKWFNPNPPGRSDGIMCDQCGYDSIARYNFCPKCGAEMER